MNEAKPGARLAGRYRLVERLGVSPDESTWRAVDATLDRQVVVWILRPGHPFADDVLDAARRVALIDDRRLIKVLDVGTDSGVNGDRAYVVNEWVEGQTLESMVQRQPLSAAAARRVAGETAEGLAAAASRGLHHLKLTPRLVTVTSKGLIKISGLAVQAAAGGLDPGHATRANRTDATALIGLLYSALTGRWPLGDAGFPPAPRTSGGGPVAAGDLVADVPADLNALCARSLGDGGDGPGKPADVALELTPWSSAAQADLLGSGSRVQAPAAGPPAAAPGRAVETGHETQRPEVGGSEKVGKPAEAAPAVAAAPAATPVTAAASTPATQDARPRTPGTRPADGHRPPGRPQSPGAQPPGARPSGAQTPGARPSERTGDNRFRPSPPVMPPPMTAPAVGRSGPGSPALRPGLGPAPHPGPAAREGSSGQSSGGQGSGGQGQPGLFMPNAPTPAQSQSPGPSQSKSPGQTPAAGPGSARTGSNGATKPGATRPGAARIGAARIGASRTGTTPVRPATPAARPADGTNGHRPNGHQSVRSTGEQLMPWASSWSPSTEAPSALESTGPFPLVLPQETPPPAQSRAVLLAVLGVLCVLVVIAAFTLRGLLPGGDADVAPGATVATGPSLADPTPADPTPSVSGSAGTDVPEPPVAPQIAAIRAIDPQADGDENTADSPQAVDGDTTTSWASQTYTSSRFGGLKKGVGLAIRLKQRTAVSRVELQVRGSGGRVQLRLGPSSDVTASTSVDSAALDGGTTALEPNRSLKARYVILWFTELPRTSEGYKAEVVEVRVT